MRYLLLRPILQYGLTLLCIAAPAAAQWQRMPYNSTIGYDAGSFYNEVFFIDNNNGWITGFNTTVLHTTNGGTTWQTGTLPNGGGSSNRDLCFVSSSVGFLSGEDGIWKTTNGG